MLKNISEASEALGIHWCLYNKVAYFVHNFVHYFVSAGSKTAIHSGMKRDFKLKLDVEHEQKREGDVLLLSRAILARSASTRLIKYDKSSVFHI